MSTLKTAIEARRKAEEQIKKVGAFNTLTNIQKSMKRWEEMEANHLKTLEHFKIPDVVSDIQKSMQRWEEMEANHLKTLEHFKIPDVVSDIQKSMQRWEEMEANYIKTLEHFKIQDRASELLQKLLEPSLSAQKMIERLSYKWEDTFISLQKSLGDFAPSVTMIRDSLVIEDEQFSQEHIKNILEEYIWDENNNKNIFKQENKHLWGKIPKPIRWLIGLILGTIIAIYITAFYKEATKNTVLNPETIARNIHFRKQEVRQIGKTSQKVIHPPFVNIEDLSVYATPQKRGQIIAILHYPCKVKILKFKNKKRWVLIEWRNESNEVNQGWVLGRYIYRKNTLSSE